jgi:excisionase family DNA binding protein
VITDVENAVAFAITEAKARGVAEVSVDDLLLGCLYALSRFGVVVVGGVTIDLEQMGVLWVQRPEKNKAARVAYSAAVVRMMDLAAMIAKGDGADGMRPEHLLVAFAAEEDGLMGGLKRRYGWTSASWRAAVAQGVEFQAMKPVARDVDGASGPATATRDYLTPEEAAEALGLHVQTLRGYVRTGKLPAFRLAGERAIRIRRGDLEAVLEPLVT